MARLMYPRLVSKLHKGRWGWQGRVQGYTHIQQPASQSSTLLTATWQGRRSPGWCGRERRVPGTSGPPLGYTAPNRAGGPIPGSQSGRGCGSAAPAAARGWPCAQHRPALAPRGPALPGRASHRCWVNGLLAQPRSSRASALVGGRGPQQLLAWCWQDTDRLRGGLSCSTALQPTAVGPPLARSTTLDVVHHLRRTVQGHTRSTVTQ